MCCLIQWWPSLPKTPGVSSPGYKWGNWSTEQGTDLPEDFSRRWLSLSFYLLFPVCVPKWPMYLLGGWYLLDRWMSELTNCLRSMAGQSRAGSLLSSHSQLLCLLLSFCVDELNTPLCTPTPGPQASHVWCSSPPPPQQTKWWKVGQSALVPLPGGPQAWITPSIPSSIHLASSSPPTTSNPTCIVVNLFL